ncbi:MAG: acyl-CoA thioesterase [Elainellaceae cyanobacterium]
MPFIYNRMIHFQDTDAAGVVYFSNVLSICHEAYEASLSVSGINLREFFSNSNIAVPITHASIDFFKPMFCGDRHQIHLVPDLLNPSEFMITYAILPDLETSKATESSAPISAPIVAKAVSNHVCINPVNRTRIDLPADLMRWLNQWKK